MKSKWLYQGRWITVDPDPSLPKRLDPNYTTDTGHRICAICGNTVLPPAFHSICGKHTYIPPLEEQKPLAVLAYDGLNLLGIYERGGGPKGTYFTYNPDVIGHPPLTEDEEETLGKEFASTSIPLLIALVIERLHNLNYPNKQ